MGLHVVGITRNHPEFLWGTFEQVQNSPDLANPAGYNSPNPVSSQNYTFYAAGTAAKDCNQLATVSVSNPTSQTLAPITNVFRQYATGGENAAGDAEIANITSQSQKALLAMKNTAEAVWANYKLIGTAWLPPGGLQPGDGSLDSQAVGSSNLADSILETFVQGPQNNNGTNASCFMCHTTEGFSNFGIPGKNISALSHLVPGTAVCRGFSGEGCCHEITCGRGAGDLPPGVRHADGHRYYIDPCSRAPCMRRLRGIPFVR